jgi:hypothetical protein
MRRPFPVFILMILGAFAFLGCHDNGNTAVYTANLTGGADVPPKTTTATGSATLNFDGTGTVHFTVVVHEITHVTEAVIASGTADENGPVRVTLLSRERTGPMDGTLADGTFTSANVKGISLDTLLGEMKSGDAYVSVITGDDPAGAIRGQIQQM